MNEDLLGVNRDPVKELSFHSVVWQNWQGMRMRVKLAELGFERGIINLGEVFVN